MHRHSSQVIHKNSKEYMLKVNEIINSIYAMNHPSLQSQLQTCHHIVGEILHNDLIAHLQSISAVKLLSYQLILMLAEEESIQNRPKIKQMQDFFENNKKIKLTASLRHLLSSIKSILQEMIWKNSKRKIGTQTGFGKSSKIYQFFLQFSSLLDEYDRQTEDPEIQTPPSSKSDLFDDDMGNQALIQQLEEMISKKQKRIKELNEQLQQSILDQKSLEDLVDELESRNGDLTDEIERLKERIGQNDKDVISLQQKIEQLQKNNMVLDKELEKRKQSSRTIPEQGDEGNPIIKKNINLINLGQKKKQCQVCAQRQLQKNIQLEQYQRALLIQSISIEAMI